MMKVNLVETDKIYTTSNGVCEYYKKNIDVGETIELEIDEKIYSTL